MLAMKFRLLAVALSLPLLSFPLLMSAAESSGEAVYAKRCSGCHEQTNPRVPHREALQKMPVGSSWRLFIPSELVVWAAGVKAPDVLAHLDGLEVNQINQLVVHQTLQTTRDPNIFAMGDCAACPRPGEPTPVPPRAQAAHQQAAHMVRQIERRLRGEPLLPYSYRDFGSLVSLGEYSTVGNLMGFLVGRSIFIEGMFARLMYRSLEALHERVLYGIPRTALRLLARMLSRRTGPRVKLH